jgi:galactose mutarotase-like enzyme
MIMKISTIVHQGLEALTLETDALRVIVIPGWGGKIASLYDRRRAREWLHVNPHLPYRLPAYGADYVRDYDAGGFDECFPNIGVGAFPTAPWAHVQLPDHGEVWALPWSVEQGDGQLTLRVHGVQLPYHLQKTVALRDNVLRCDYLLTNPTPFAMPFIWSSHPTFAVQPGMRLEVPVRTVQVYGSVGEFPLAAGETAGWPQSGDEDLSILPPRTAARAAKLFFTALDAGRVAVADPADGSRCTLLFDQALTPHVGVWMNSGAWAGVPDVAPYYNLAVEPCIGADDGLADAWAAGTAGVLPAYGERRWWLEMVVA